MSVISQLLLAGTAQASPLHLGQHTLCPGSPMTQERHLTQGWLTRWLARGHCQGLMQKALPNGSRMTGGTRRTDYL